MDFRNRHAALKATAAGAAVVLLAGAGAGWIEAGSGAQNPRGGLEALDYAFRFASAIKTDEKDRAKAQEGVVRDLSAAGALDEAIRRAGEIEGWRRGALYADLAVALAGAGRKDEARGLVEKAEAVRSGVQGWENPRIRAHVAQALSALGEVERARAITSELAANDRQYAGRSVATVSTGLAARGDFDAAMESLGGLDGEADLEIAWWRTAGYLAASRQAGLPAKQRREALDAARRSAEIIPGWKKPEALESIAGEYRSLEDAAAARLCLEAAEAIVTAQPDTLAIKAALLSNLARDWADFGDKARGRGLLDRAEGLVAGAMIIDRPALYAILASSRHQVGQQEEAARLYDQSLSAAASLKNARPRALAVVEICRSLGRSGVALDSATRKRLDELYSGLGEPW